MRMAHLLATALLGLLLSGCASMRDAPTPGVRQALAPTGKLRVGLVPGNPMQMIRGTASGVAKGVALDLGRELAQRASLPFEAVEYRSLGELLVAGKSGEWDVAFILVNPARMKDFDFTAPTVELELGYLVPKLSAISAAGDVDRPGVRVGVLQKSTADAILARALKNAVLVRSPDRADGLKMLQSGNVDVYAANKAVLSDMSDRLPGSRVLDGRFGAERIAMAIPKGRDAGLAYARKFIKDALAEGLVKAAVERAGVRGAVVAGPQ